MVPQRQNAVVGLVSEHRQADLYCLPTCEACGIPLSEQGRTFTICFGFSFLDLCVEILPMLCGIFAMKIVILLQEDK